MTQVAELDLDLRRAGHRQARLVLRRADRLGDRPAGADWITWARRTARRSRSSWPPTTSPPQWPGPEHPQQFHLDLLVDEHQAAAERAVALGATRLADGPTWITLADPAGHPFDLCQRDGVGPVMGLFAVTIDAPDASALARFYAELHGHGGDLRGARGRAHRR